MARNKTQRMADHIATNYEKKGMSVKEATSIGNAVAKTYAKTGKKPNQKGKKK